MKRLLLLPLAVMATMAMMSAPAAQVMRTGLPDATLTPGALNPHVTQATIHQTICVHGWTATVRPPVSYTNRLKREQIAQYGYTDTNMRDYEEDHDISLELGGSPTNPKNLWPEPHHVAGHLGSRTKDTLENHLKRMVCSGNLSLAKAQHMIATNWVAAYRRYYHHLSHEITEPARASFGAPFSHVHSQQKGLTMAFQYSVTLRNAFVGQTDSTVGSAPLLEIYTGTIPTNCGTAATGTQLVSMTLPTTWLGAAASGAVALSGTWTGTGAAAGTAGYFRIYDPTGTTCHVQGTITATGGGGDMTLDNTSIASGQTVNVTSFTMTAGGA